MHLLRDRINPVQIYFNIPHRIILKIWKIFNYDD